MAEAGLYLDVASGIPLAGEVFLPAVAAGALSPCEELAPLKALRRCLYQPVAVLAYVCLIAADPVVELEEVVAGVVEIAGVCDVEAEHVVERHADLYDSALPGGVCLVGRRDDAAFPVLGHRHVRPPVNVGRTFERILHRHADEKNSLKTMASIAQQKKEAGMWSTGHPRHAIRHEIAHAIQKHHALSDSSWSEKTQKIFVIYEKALENLDGYSLPSIYAADDMEEFISECIAASFAKKKSKTVKEVIAIILGGDV